MGHLPFFRHETGLLGHTEHLCKMEFLTLICNINIPVRAEFLLTLENRSQIRGGVECRTVGFADDTGREFLGITGLGDIDHQCALALISEFFLFQFLNQPRNIGLSITLSFP